MRYLIAITGLLVFLLTIIGCGDDDSVNPDETCLVALAVVDTAGQSVAGLNVGSINHSDFLVGRTPPPQALPSTEIAISIAEPGPVTLTIYDYYGTVIDRPYDNELLQAGTYSVYWGADTVLYGFYRYELIAGDLSADKWVVLSTGPEPQQSIFGQTDGSGQWQTNDTLLFPCLLGAPPPITIQDGLGNPLDTTNDFYNDTVTFTLSDPAYPDSFQYYERAVSPHGNEFELVWE